jgi:diguanylate cyclase (GGDEF)-like protein
VIVVDDDRTSRAVLEDAIVQLGHRCRVAVDGQEAWEMHQARRADVIISDWQMPRMDGVELCRRTRVAEAGTGYTYFIFMTAFGDRAHFLRGMDAGADDYQTKPVDLEELEARLVSAGRVLAVHRKLAESNSKLRRDSQASFRVARLDPLTKIANRLQMAEDLETIWSQSARYGRHYSAAICDIDWFKKYNDAFGHLAGDDVLRRVAAAIRCALRQSDSLYRYGGEEFLVVLPEQSAEDARLAMDRVRRAVEELGIQTDDGRVTISVGVAELGSADTTLDAWIGRADRALYAAKARGRNRVEVDG